MIGRVDFYEGQISPGESRPLHAWTDAEPLFVAIQCFREPPNPPALTGCAECGSYHVDDLARCQGSGIPSRLYDGHGRGHFPAPAQYEQPN